MSIFKVKSKEVKEDGTRFVGVHLPLQISSYLYLHCLAKGFTISSVLSEVIKDWVYSRKIELIQKELIQELLSKTQEKWDESQKIHPAMQLVVFQNNVIRELESKGIEKEIIKTIINSLV